MYLKNQVCDILRIHYPIIQGGMGNISNAELSSSISEAGGLGTIGVGTMTPEEVESIIIKMKQLTNKPFALNIPIQVTPYMKEMVSLIEKYKIETISLSAGDPKELIPILHKLGCVVLVVVGTAEQAKKAEQKGADLIVAEGYEAAGINSTNEITTFTLIPQVVSAVSIPVIAAGGIADGLGLAAALSLGAMGVQLGTRFIATSEAPFSKEYKQLILQSRGTDTAIVGRQVGRIRRVLSTKYIDDLLVSEQIGITLSEFNEKTSEDYHKIGALTGDFVNGYVNGGQVVGLITSIVSVKELLHSMVEEAKKRAFVITNLL